MIKIVLDHTQDQGDIFRPAVFCDDCDQEITDPQEAMYMWHWERGKVHFAHKDGCSERLEWRYYGTRRQLAWGEMTAFADYIVYNWKVMNT